MAVVTQGEDELESSSAEGERDRAAILARRRRFVALALTGLATAGCTRAAQPEACLSVTPPEDQTQPIEEDPPASDSNGPFVEDPGQPVQSTDPDGEGDSGAEEPITEPRPEACLRMVQPKPTPPPKPCLKKAAPRPCLDVPAQPVQIQPKKKKPPPQPCLLMIDVD